MVVWMTFFTEEKQPSAGRPVLPTDGCFQGDFIRRELHNLAWRNIDSGCFSLRFDGLLDGIRALAQPNVCTGCFQNHGDHERVDRRDTDVGEPPLCGDTNGVTNQAWPVPGVQMRHGFFQRRRFTAPAHNIVGDHDTGHRGKGCCQKAEPCTEVTVQAEQTDYGTDYAKDHQQFFTLYFGKDGSQIQRTGVGVALSSGPDVGEQTDECHESKPCSFRI